jgi:hypothetical protein
MMEICQAQGIGLQDDAFNLMNDFCLGLLEQVKFVPVMQVKRATIDVRPDGDILYRQRIKTFSSIKSTSAARMATLVRNIRRSMDKSLLKFASPTSGLYAPFFYPRTYARPNF